MGPEDPTALPPDLPKPADDGAADHLPDATLPRIPLPATDGSEVLLSDPRPGVRTVLYAYPRTGRPGEPELTDDWDLIPGARGCTPEACAFRDHHQELVREGAEVFGLSTQDTADQREAAERLRLPFPLLSDAELRLTRALRLPTFSVGDHVLLKRFTLILRDARIEHVFYPVFPPNAHAEEVLGWLRTQRTG
jgi:peroxiredoxin